MKKNLREIFNYLLILLIHIVFIIDRTYSQEILFENLQYEQVLDNQTVLTITKDNDGKLWFGGKGTLFNYDSKTIKSIFESNNFVNENFYINKIIVDPYNNIIIGTDKGLLTYNQNTKQYSKILIDSILKTQVNDIKIFQNKIVAATRSGIFLINYNPKEQSYSIEKTIENNPTQLLEIIDDKSFLYSVKNKIYKYSTLSTNKSLIEKIITLPNEKHAIKAISVEKEKIWAGTNGDGLYIISNRKIIHQINEATTKLAHNNIRKIIPYNNKIYVGTQKGLSVIDNAYNIINYAHQKDNPSSISQNSIYDLYKDDQNVLWIGTYYGGINAIFPKYFSIEILNSTIKSKYRLDSDVTSAYAEDENFIYVGSDESGLYKINKKTKETTKIETTSSLIKDLLLIENLLYIAQHKGGITVYDTKSQTIIRNIDISDDLKAKISTNKIIANRKGEIFVATDEGIFQLIDNKLIKKTSQYLQSNVLAVDRFNNIYTILSGKICIKHPHIDTFKEFAIKNIKDYIFNVITTPDGKIYISTSSSIYEVKNNYATQIYQVENNIIYNIFSYKNTIWITTAEGLIQYNLNTKNDFLFNKYDGITTSNLNNANFFLSKDNLIYLCTLKGINVINPEDIQINMTVPSVMLNSIFINEKEHSLSNISFDSEPIKLTSSYDQNNFTIDFSSTNFIKPQKNKYKYKLEGFDKEWIYTNNPIAKYMNIQPGKYKLKMQASNNDGVWSEKELILDIEVTPPIWKTWWAYVCYIFAFLVAIHYIIKFIVERQLLLSSEKEYEKKLQFFTQISHEIRTPLTLITVPIEDILQSTKDDKIVYSKIIKLQKNANKLLSIVNELLDFKKIDSGKQSLYKQEVDLKFYLEETFYIFSELAIAKDINYYIKKLDIKSNYSIDVEQFDKVLYNLISNAIKYTPNNGTVYLEAFEEKKQLIINIVDNGIGIDENNQFKIFEEFYRDPKAQEIIGTGIGLALTKTIVEQHDGNISCYTMNNEGNSLTIFAITLPILQELAEKVETNNTPKHNAEHQTKSKSEQTILIVEDNIELSETITSLFADQFDIIKAYNGQEGIELATKYLPDIIITDLMMPILDGIQMVESIKKNFITSHIPIIMLTADTNESSKISGLKFGANVYLEKPFNTSILNFSVNNLIQISSKNRKEFDIQKNNLNSEIDKKFIDKVENIILQNLLNPDFGVDLLAKEIGVSQPILYKKLKSITDLSVNNFIKQYRFKKAIELLNTDKNISEVAYAVGFSDRKYFSKEFKKQFGLNPSEYIEQINPKS